MSKFQVFATPDAPAAFTLLDMGVDNFLVEKASLLDQGFEVIGEPILAPDANTAAHEHQLNLADPSRPYGGPGTIGLFKTILLHAPRLFGKKGATRR